MSIPKPRFESCDETSIKIKWDDLDQNNFGELKLQYKEVHQSWEEAKEFNISCNSLQVDLESHTGEAVDLKPGTPYNIRIKGMDASGSTVFGPATVFDTKPVDCGPKKSCTLS